MSDKHNQEGEKGVQTTACTLQRIVGHGWIERTTGKKAVITRQSGSCVTWRYARSNKAWLTTTSQFISRFTPNTATGGEKGKGEG